MHRSVLVALVAATAEGFSPMISPSNAPRAGLGKLRGRCAGSSSTQMNARPDPSGAAAVSRRAALAAVPLFLVTTQKAYAKGDAPAFDGAYTYPKHPGCPRNIGQAEDKAGGDSKASLENIVDVTGADGTPGCTSSGPTKAWRLSGKVKGDQIFVDFSPKGGPKDLVGKWEGDGIRWPDSNKWSKVSGSVPSDL